MMLRQNVSQSTTDLHAAIQIANEVLADVQPSGLRNADPEIAATVQLIIDFLNEIISG
jgi:hypothetical protein